MKTEHTHAASPSRAQRVLDDRGGVYELGKRIAEGGQGIVCPTQDPRYLVKISKYPASDARADSWLQQIAAVQRMPITESDLPVAMPVALITKPRPGYVMEMMDGLVPLDLVLNETFAASAAGDAAGAFLRSGGLSRRLSILARLARTMARLHGLAIAHGDLSPKNIFVSRSVEHHEVWLIDCDNLTYAVRDSSLKLYTPDYGAPEIFRGDRGISTYTDIWSFAVIAFQTLTLLHPFKSGQLVDSDSELETAAFRGELPWVDHQSDERNRAAEGIPREFVCTPEIWELFRRCFEEGVEEPTRRPTMAEWAEAFEAAAAIQVGCDAADGGCGSTFLWSANLQCPFCGQIKDARAVLVMDHFVHTPMSHLPEDAKAVDRWIATGFRQIVCRHPVALRTVPPGSATYADSPAAVTASVHKGDLLLNIESGDVRLQTAGVKQLELLRGRVQLRARAQMLALHFGSIASPHAVWRLHW